MTEKGDLDERKRAREVDRLRRESEAIARLLRRAVLDGVKADIEAAKAQLVEVEARLETSSKDDD
ncbi:MAG: hypothetical protein P8Q45_03515 [Candidatus Thalassarchaeaceae archaeon]|nr:hypothetical protein [Candidatus Thalassarchaeaceae archaeon]